MDARPPFHSYFSPMQHNLIEGVDVQFRAEFFNLFNHTQAAGVNTSFGAAAFGQVVSARDPRITQLGLRLLF